MRIYQVGGSVRDKLLGLDTKDIDFAVEGVTFDELRDHLVDEGFEIYVETPQYLTIRCRIPEGHHLRSLAKDADFTLCRSEGVYTDARHPDSVAVASIHTDLARRDFTINAIAIDTECGHVIDPFFGRDHLNQRRLFAVGDPIERFAEDPLRALRGIRFTFTKGLEMALSVKMAMVKSETVDGLAALPIERIYEELKVIFKEDTAHRLREFMRLTTPEFQDAVFRDGLHLLPSLAE